MVDESTVGRAIKNKNSFCGGYRIRVDNKKNRKGIDSYCNEKNIIYLIDNNKIVESFENATDFLSKKESLDDLKSFTKINQCLAMIHKYKGLKIIYKSDYDRFKCYPSFKLNSYKYILKFTLKGKLLDVIENIYGLKFTGAKADNCKLNTRINLLQKNIPYRIYEAENVIYMKSNEIINNIKTNICLYQITDISNNAVLEFVRLTELCKYLKIKKIYCEYYMNNNKIFNEKFKIEKVFY